MRIKSRAHAGHLGFPPGLRGVAGSDTGIGYEAPGGVFAIRWDSGSISYLGGDEVIWLIEAEDTCEEASPFSGNFYIPCGRPASAVVHHKRDQKAYRMCDGCADHNVTNRGGVALHVENPSPTTRKA